MALVILQNQRSFHIQAAIEKISNDNTLYIGIAKDSNWPNESVPPVPEDTIDERADFFSNLIYIQKTTTTKIIPVVRRINWTVGIEYNLFDTSSEDAYVADFYVLNSENRVYKVATKTGSSVVATEPTGVNQGINTGDGYTWDYLYNIEPADADLLINEWIPVRDLGNPTTEQSASGDVRSMETLGAEHILVRSEVSDIAIPEDISYRQLGLLFQPLDNTNNPITGVVAEGSEVKDAGMLLSIENRKAQPRASGQTENFNTIIRLY